MGRTREPISLIEAKGKKHLTKTETEKRKLEEVKVGCEAIVVPSYLTAKQKKEFKYWAEELKKARIMTDLDSDALARYIVSKEYYIKANKEVRNQFTRNAGLDLVEQALNIQDKAFKQCNAAARELGLTVSSRCKLVVTPEKEDPKENKFSKFDKGQMG
jgi:P27 family predicted phage terminase small subunit